MTGQPEHVMVVGAGLAGLRTVEQLRDNLEKAKEGKLF